MTFEPEQPQDRPGMIVLFGPTASGKSDLALRLAERYRGTIINADSVQLYRELRVLTARPDRHAEQRVPHRLYGILSADESGSVGDWLDRVEDELARAQQERRVPVVVGGTGLYIRALLDGLAPVPEIPKQVREEVRALVRCGGPDGVLRRLREHDPQAPEGRDRPGDLHRLMRALEVVRATGRPLRGWQAEPPRRLFLPEPVVRIALAPARAALRARIEGRLSAMIEAGAVEEVRALRGLGVDRSKPAMKAVAVRDLLAYLDGRTTLEAALQRATVETRRYAKRQFTWLRHRMPDFAIIAEFGDAVDDDLAVARPAVTDAAGAREARASSAGQGLDVVPGAP